MEQWTKTDKFVELLNDAIFSIIWPGWFGPKMDKEDTIKNLTKQYFILYYKLAPFRKITFGDDNKETAKQFLEKCRIQTEPYFDVIYDVLRADYPNYKDLGAELWELCPDAAALPQYIQISRGKFKEILEGVPDKEYYSLVNLFADNPDNDIAIQVRKHEQIGTLTKKESRYILTKVCHIVEQINFAIDLVAKGYNDIKTMAGVENNPVNEWQTDEIILNDSQIDIIYNGLQQYIKEGKEVISYAFNGGNQPDEYNNRLTKSRTLTDALLCYLIYEILTSKLKIAVNWDIARRLGIKDPDSKRERYSNNKGDKPRNHSIIDKILSQF